eukprot:CAMPEP_0181173828 /NCGR_PEP_ID=MMETSP1096-20121128/3206_1 /TAXON_ID=156174 ORGANISM="Chrysochromulina ericina, Strain CCMP281" /NCGR_SAMPLE_ID=MMETSP1096 /ASSEMBLY_ACC=CAM_ASM_000453 /LENGTH=47 /DNA_ID= /DNA_START= /DNA_END= /DNA_ORIENTATION=
MTIHHGISDQGARLRWLPFPNAARDNKAHYHHVPSPSATPRGHGWLI